MSDRGPDPNEGSTDPMVQEYWLLGEEVQDKIRAAGYESETVEGIAVDIHDLLQAADRIRDDLAPMILSADLTALGAKLDELRLEMNHLRWHAENAEEFLLRVGRVLSPSQEQPL